MGRYLLGRLLASVPVVFGVVLTVFVLLRLVPGDPVQIFFYGSETSGTSSSPVSKEILERTRASYNLDKPIPVQFVLYCWDLLHLNLGRSFRTDQPITDIIR